MIEIGDGIFWDDTLPFDEQSEECKELINEKMKDTPVKDTDGICGRINIETWDNTTYDILRTYNYLANNTAHNCFALSSTIITVEEK